jgi:2-polyprenyl-6-methoxyphenol hydroxylase-like FAD-dependent oxidoreductase
MFGSRSCREQPRMLRLQASHRGRYRRPSGPEQYIVIVNQNIAILIVGAGPTGLTLACDLARRKVSFRIVDKGPEYFAGSRGKGLQPRSLEVLDDLGVVDKILANGRFHLPFRGYDGPTVLGDHDMHEGRVPTPDIPYASPLLIPQWRVEEILRNRLAEYGACVELATELTGFEQNDAGVTATLVHSGRTEQVLSRFLVGADGGHSFVRKKLSVGFEGETWKTERMLIADVRIDGLDREHWHSWPKNEAGWLALCPLPSTDSFQFQAQIPVDEPDDPTLERLQQIVNERTGRSDIRLHDATWLSLYRPNVRMVDRYRVGRVFLAGDAAHVHSPVGGQGMNTGIQDAYNLGWKLGQVLSGARDQLLDTYEEERLPVAASMLGITTKLHRQVLGVNTSEPRRGPETLQLGINYRGSSLAREVDNSSPNIHAGDRAPDAPCSNSLGTSTRLFDAFRGPHFTLLAFGACHAGTATEMNQRCGSVVHTHSVLRTDTPIGSATFSDSLFDIEGHAHRAYDAKDGTLVLVRPDSYVGFIANDDSLSGVQAYLENLVST